NLLSRSVLVTRHAAPLLSNIEASPLSFAEGDSTTAVTSTLTVSAVNSSTLVGASIAITGNFAGTEDSLGFSDQNGIIGSYDAATGVLTLSGVASLADYQSALRSVTYLNSSQNPSVAQRTIFFQVDDGFAFNHVSNIQTRRIGVGAVNDAPSLEAVGSP